MGIEFSESASMAFFYLLFVMSAGMAGLGGYVKRHYWSSIGKTLILVGFVMQFIPMGFRKVGIDYEIYREWFDNAEFWLGAYYHFTPEPLFAALTLFAKNVLNNFQYIYLAAAFVFLLGIYRFLLAKECFGYISILFINVSIYLYMCGLVRISLAIGVLSIAYVHIDQLKWFFLLLLVAVLFHYTAVIGGLVYIAYRSKRSFAMKYVFWIIGGIVALSILINHFSDVLPYAIMRYAGYMTMTLSIRNISTIIIIIPALMLWLLYRFSYRRLYGFKYRFYDNIVKILLILLVVSMMFNGMFRLSFFFYPFVAKIYYDFSRVLCMTRQESVVPVYLGVFTIVGLVYVYEVFFTSPFITPSLIPFSM